MAAVSNPEIIDREKKCPFLLRVFCSSAEHNNLGDFNEGKVSYFLTFKLRIPSILSKCSLYHYFRESTKQ